MRGLNLVVYENVGKMPKCIEMNDCAFDDGGFKIKQRQYIKMRPHRTGFATGNVKTELV